MTNNIENIDDLLGKYLSGEASESEQLQVAAWLEAADQNRYYFNQLKLIFDKAATVPQTMEFNTDAAWEKVRSNLKKKSAPVIPIQRKSYSMWYQIAAAVLVLFIAMVYLVYKPFGTDDSRKEFVAEKSAVRDTLPGGTDIFLNRKTKLVYAFDEDTRTHSVELKGEAYFNVRHKKREKFIVEADGVFVRDIGTSFNVRAYPDQEVVEVQVEEGEIVFFTKDNPGIHLHAGGKGVYNRKTGSFSIEAPDANITAYKTRFFVFDATTLDEIVKQLNLVYNRQIVIDERLQRCRLTVSFKDESIEEIAEVIAETLAVDLRVAGDSLILEGKGCE